MSEIFLKLISKIDIFNLLTEFQTIRYLTIIVLFLRWLIIRLEL